MAIFTDVGPFVELDGFISHMNSLGFTLMGYSMSYFLTCLLAATNEFQPHYGSTPI